MMEKEVGRENNYVEELVEILRSDIPKEELLDKLADYHENDIAGAFEELTEEERKVLYPILGSDLVSQIFSYIDDVEEYMKELDLVFAAEIIENMDSDDAVDVLEEMDDSDQEIITSMLGQETTADIELIRSYEDDEMGSVMTTNFICIHKAMTVPQAMHALISQAEKNDNISTLYVTDDEDKFYGALDLKDLIVARKDTILEPLMSTSYPYVYAHDKISECIDRIVDYAEDSIPVLDEDQGILGIITAQDLIEVVDDEMGDDYAKLAGLTSEEDLEESLFVSMKKRLPWLIALLFLGMGVSSVVGMFETVVSQIAVIVCFQSLILGMAGNIGTQSLAVTIRVLMDEDLKRKQKIMLIFKELKIGFSNGLLLGILAFGLIGVYVAIFKHYTWSFAFSVSGCVGIALLVAMVISSFVGTIVPMFFNKIHIDPAVASGPLISTVNDLVAVITYYGLAWLLLIHVMHLV